MPTLTLTLTLTITLTLTLTQMTRKRLIWISSPTVQTVPRKAAEQKGMRGLGLARGQPLVLILTSAVTLTLRTLHVATAPTVAQVLALGYVTGVPQLGDLGPRVRVRGGSCPNHSH